MAEQLTDMQKLAVENRGGKKIPERYYQIFEWSD